MGILVALVLAFVPPDSEYPTTFFGPTNDFEERIRQLSNSIERIGNDLERAEELSHLFSLRGINRMLAGHPEEEALDDLDIALELDPKNSIARAWRADCYEKLGDPISAQADRILMGGTPTGRFSPLSVDYSIRPSVVWLIAGGVWIGLVFVNVIVGWPQKMETGSSIGPLLRASCVLSLLASLPIAILAAHATRGDLPASWWTVAVAATTIGMASCSMFLKPPVFLQGTKTKLPRVLDEEFLNRVSELAARMQVPVPLVRLWPSVDGSQRALAFAGTIHAPQLVVTDGIIHRLEPAECDAIIAHELGHIANRSLWWLCTPLPLGCAAAVAVLPLMPISLAVAFGFAFFVGLKRLISQPVELDCDRRAAKAIGFRAAIGALAKIHAVHPIQNSGVLSMLVYATSTHPSRDVRLASLYDSAPPDDIPAVPPDRAGIARQRLSTVAALVIWTGSLAGTLALSLLGYHSRWLDGLLWGVALLPLTLLVIAGWKATSVSQRRLGQQFWYLKFAIAAGVVLIVILVLRSRAAPHRMLETRDELPYAALVTFLLMMIGVGALTLWMLMTNRRRKLLREIGVAFQVHDFRGVLDLCRNSPNVVRRSHLLRYNQALAQAFCGDVSGAIEALETLWTDKPRFPLTGFALCSFLLDSDRPERVLEIARRLGELLPGDPQPAFFEASALRDLNRPEEAEAACQQAIELEPRNGPSYALRAALALDRGETERALELCEKASELSPGDVCLRIVEAEIALSRESLDVARAAVGRAVDAIRGNPMSVRNSELRRLQGMLDERLSPAVAEDIFLE